MRTNEFTYKKTRKVVTEYQGISLDLTLQEAADLHEVIGHIGGIAAARPEFLDPLWQALSDFIGKNEPWIKPRLRMPKVEVSE